MASNKDAELDTPLLALEEEGQTPPGLLLLGQESPPTLTQPMPRPQLPPPRFGKLIMVLSIDGGGIRGLIPAVVLKCLQEKLQAIDGEDARIADYFDVIAGTSTGALIAAMLVTPDHNKRPKYTPQDIQDFYMDNGPKIFPPKRSWWWWPLDLLRAWWGPKYDGKFLQDKIREVTGKHTLADTLSKLVVPTFDVNILEPLIFSSYKDGMQTLIEEVKPEVVDEVKPEVIDEVKPGVSDVCIGTTAAPTYFPAHYFDIWVNGINQSKYHLIDGGVAANNPTMAAISRITKEQLLMNPEFRPDGVDYMKYLVVSLGTGSAVNGKGLYTSPDCAKWGAFNWLYNISNSHSPLIDIFSQASAVLADWHVRMLLHNNDQPGDEQNYLRIQAQDPLFRVDMLPMDNATNENMHKLVTIGEKLLQEKVARVDFTTGRYQFNMKPDARTNDQEIERFAQSLVDERNLRLRNQKEEQEEEEEEEEDGEEVEETADPWQEYRDAFWQDFWQRFDEHGIPDLEHPIQ